MFLTRGTLGPLTLPNRIIRAGTGESMADADGGMFADYIELHRKLALEEWG